MLTDVFSCVFLFGCVFIYIFIIFSFRSVPASGLDAVIPSANQLTIFYNGSVCVYDGIPAEKVYPCCTLIMNQSCSCCAFNPGSNFTCYELMMQS